MSKIKFLIAIVAMAFGLVGCSTTPKMTQSVVKGIVQMGVAIGASEKPDIIPYLRDYAAPVICEAASGTNVQPAWVIAKLESNDAAQAAKTEFAAAIFSSAFGIYEGLYAQFGADEVQNRAQLQAWLSGVCEGILSGLPSGTNTFRLQALPPHVKWH